MQRTLGRTAGRLVATVLLAGAAVLPATAAHAQSAPVSPQLGGVYHAIKNSGDGLCLEPSGQSTAVGAAIVQQPCVTSGTESLAQGWQYVKTATNHYKFVNQLSGLCLDVRQKVNGSPMIQWGCATISNEEFNTGTSLPAVAKIESRIGWTDSGYCLDVPGAEATPGLGMQLWQCNGTPAQVWVNGF
jgi:hypothetical protein